MLSNVSCPIANRKQEMLIDYAAQRLNERETQRVTEHAAQCPECQTFLAGQAEVWSALDALEAPVLSDDFNRRLYARIAQEKQDWWWSRAWRRVFFSGPRRTWRPAAVSALCAVLAVAAIYISDSPQTSPARPAPGAAERMMREYYEADAMEAVLDDLEMLQVLSSAGSAL